MRIVKADLTLK